MSGRPVTKGTLNVSSVIRIIDSLLGTPETGVVAATTGLALNYRREGEAAVAITTINNLALLTTAHTDGGILHIGDGYYRVDFQDAAFAAGAGEDGVLLTGTATGMIVIGTYHPLVDYDPYDAVRMGMTALPNVAAGAAGGLPDDTDLNGRVRVVDGTGAGELDTASGAVTVGTIAADAITASAVATGAIDATAMAAGSIASGVIASGELDNIAASIWNEVANTRNTVGSMGQILNAHGPISGTISGVPTTQVIATDNGETTVGAFIGAMFAVTDGVALGEARMIFAYDGAGEFTLSDVLFLAPASGDHYVILPADANIEAWRSLIPNVLTSGAVDSRLSVISEVVVDAINYELEGTADSGTTTTLVDAAALTQADDYWNGSLLEITDGTLAGQVRPIVDFDAATDTITVDPPFTVAVGTHTYGIAHAATALVSSSQPLNTSPTADTVGDSLLNAARSLPDDTAPAAAGGLPTIGTGAGQINVVTGTVDANIVSMAADTITASAYAIGAIAADAFVAGAIDVTAAPNLDAAISTRSTPAQVATEISDALRVDTVTLPGQVAPPILPTFAEMASWNYKVMRNRKDQTSTLWQLYADNETTVDAKATVSDDATTAIKQEIVTGP